MMLQGNNILKYLFKQCSTVQRTITNEVIVYRVMMCTNPLLIVQATYFTSKGQSVYYITRG